MKKEIRNKAHKEKNVKCKIRQMYPKFFWKTCDICFNKFKKEYMWEIEDKYNIVHICKECSPTQEDVELYVRDFPMCFTKYMERAQRTGKSIPPTEQLKEREKFYTYVINCKLTKEEIEMNKIAEADLKQMAKCFANNMNQSITVNMWAVIGKKGYYNFKIRQFTFKASMECMLPSKDVAKIMASYLDEPTETCMVQISVTEYIEKYIRDSFKSLTIPVNSKFY